MRGDDEGTSSSSSSSSSNSSSKTTITEILSEDQLVSILFLLPLESILSFAMTCKKTNLLLESNNGLWKTICNRDWAHSTLDAFLSNNNIWDWRSLYQRLRNLDRISCLSSPSTSEVGPTARASHSLNYFKGCLLLFGGGSEGGRHLDDTWIANDFTSSRGRSVNWQRLVTSNGPTGRFGHSCVVIDDCLVLFGGINDTGIRQNDTWIAQPAANSTLLSWRLLDVGPLAPPTRGAHACSSIDNRRMIIHGGIGLSGMRLGDTWVLQLSDNLCFGTWHESLTHPVPSPRSGHTLTYIGGTKTVLFGGRGMGYEVLHDVWYFDSSQAHLGWVPVLFDLRNIPGGLSLSRVGHSATTVIGGRVLIYGGEDSYRHRKNDFWLLDITSTTPTSSQIVSQRQRVLWRKLKCEGYLPRSRSFHRACADDSGRYLYVFGGMVDGILQPAQPTGLRFDGELFVAELLL
ncbi:F-box domain, cyclin-like protein [Artemisia annua]|uniref:F-box domain, cyclin-like protein n=1 Tax=Artemisia annua TaxID=35608 RepID=A0A2U1M619_ARTAN|nr:F-box domain, cyclin-like protein [Artemisia annua]